MDRLTKEKRSWNMSRIRSRNTGPELLVRSLLRRLRLRFRTHWPSLPGRPDFVLPEARIAIFVHGCFWHRHKRCRFAYTPRSKVAFWQEKFRVNQARDKKVMVDLRKSPWRPLVIWECQLRDTDTAEQTVRIAIQRLLLRPASEKKNS